MAGLEISHFVFQGGCYLLEPQGQLFTLGGWVLIQGGDDLKEKGRGVGGTWVREGEEIGGKVKQKITGRRGIGWRRVKSRDSEEMDGREDKERKKEVLGRDGRGGQCHLTSTVAS